MGRPRKSSIRAYQKVPRIRPCGWCGKNEMSPGGGTAFVCINCRAEALSSPTKKCNSCNETKPKASFTRNATCIDHTENTCKLCKNPKHDINSNDDVAIARVPPGVCIQCGVSKPETRAHWPFAGDVRVSVKCLECHGDNHPELSPGDVINRDAEFYTTYFAVVRIKPG